MYTLKMPTTEAQKRANAKWRANNKEKLAKIKLAWVENNIEKQREYSRNCNKRRYYYDKSCSYDVASKELMKCLLI